MTKIAEVESLEYVCGEKFLDETFFEFSHYIEFQSCEFDRIVFDGNFEGICFQNAIFKQCDFRNAVFSDTSFIKSTLENCNLIGTNFSGSTFLETKLENVKANYSNFHGSTFKYCHLLESDFTEVGFSRVKLEQTEFKKNRLVKGDFHGTSLKKIDFRTNEIDGIIVNLEDLNGLIVKSSQALSFFPLLGITVKEEQE